MSRVQGVDRAFGSTRICTPQAMPVEKVERGHILPTGVVISATRNEIDGEYRLETAGCLIHYQNAGDTVTVLGRVADDVMEALDA